MPGWPLAKPSIIPIIHHPYEEGLEILVSLVGTLFHVTRVTDCLSLTLSNLQMNNYEEPCNKHPALGFSWAETGAAMTYLVAVASQDRRARSPPAFRNRI